MLKYMLDTNMCIYLMRQQPARVASRFAQCKVGDVGISAITFAELEYGVSVSVNATHERQCLSALVDDIKVFPFGSSAAKAYGPVRAATRSVKRDHLDKLIAAHAIALQVILVTNNERDFAAYPALRIENWTHS